VVAVAAVAASEMKTSVATAMVGVTDNNQPKLAAEEMAAEMAMATVTTTPMARTMMAGTMTVVAAAFLPDRQQSTKIGSGRNGGNNVDSNGNGDGASNDNNGRGQQ
jgi:hypothetical protein